MEDLSNENVIHIIKNGVQYLQFRKLLEYKDIIAHAYSLGTEVNYRPIKANGQKLSENEYTNALKNYSKLCDELKINYINLMRPNQNHTDKIITVEEIINKEEPDFNLDKYTDIDGAITNKKDIILSTTNADCILLLFFDPVKKVIANTHSGWKGTLQRISVKTVEKMIKEFKCNPKDIICCMCPSIRKCHFEVNIDVKEMFEKEFKNLEQIDKIIEQKESNKKWNIDTILINKIVLEKAGLKKENIIDSGICSVCNSGLIHSFRVEKEGYGLNTALIELK